MSEPSVAELSVPYDPGQLTARVERRRRRLRSRLISLAITLALLVAIYFWRGDQPRGASSFAVYAVVLGISLAFLVAALVGFLRSRRQLVRMRSGTAVRIGPPGVEVAGAYVPWPEVASLAMSRARIGRSPALVLATTSGSRAEVALDHISVDPATLDGAVRAFSGSRQGVDLSALDN